MKLSNRDRIFIDESGNFGLDSDHVEKRPFVVVGFVYSKDSFQLTYRLMKFLKNAQLKKKWHPELNEFKFTPYRALRNVGASKEEIKECWEPHYDSIKKNMTQIILEHTDGIIASFVDKRSMLASKYTLKTLGNALIKKTLLDEMLPNIQASQLEILYDEGRLPNTEIESFNKSVLRDSKCHPLYNSSSHINKISSKDSL